MLINPWIIYLIDTIDTVNFAFLIIMLTSFFLISNWSLFGVSKIQRYKRHFEKCKELNKEPYIGEWDYSPNEYAYLTHLEKWQQKYKVMLLVSFALIVLLPSSETLMKMFVASYVTTDNLEIVKGNAKDLVDYIVKAINEIK